MKLTVYNTLGKVITELVNERQGAGKYRVTFDASNLTSGAFLQAEVNGFIQTKKNDAH